MAISRRQTLQGLAATGTAGAALLSASQVETNAATSPLSLPPAPTQLLLNRARASAVMEAEGVDLLVCADAVNVFYLTNQRHTSFSLGMDGLAYATLPASEKSNPAILCGEFSFYLADGTTPVSGMVDLKLYSSPGEPELYQTLTSAEDIINAAVGPGYLTPEFDYHEMRPYEKRRREKIAKAQADTVATLDAALLREIRDADKPNRTIAVDDPRLIPMIKASGLDVRIVDGERLIRRIRLEKSSAELSLMRYAIEANAAAALAAAQSVRAGATFQDVRAEFWKQCGSRLSKPVFMLIDGVMDELAPVEVEEGRTFLIDCVSQFQGYHGDYGRTVCVGEPKREMQQVVDALSTVWDQLLPDLKPGTMYSDIWVKGAELFAATGVDAGLVMGPHAVGLHHTDEPGATEFTSFTKDNLVLTENMVISIDMPVLGSGLGGTAHLEDLVLITKDGPEFLNASTDRFIVV